MPTITKAQVLAWRLRRQFVDPTGDDVVAIADRLCGVQAQVVSSAVTAVSARLGRPARADVERAVRDDRTLVRMWAVRGTLHLLSVRAAVLQCAVLGAQRTWDRPVWFRAAGVSRDEVRALLDAIAELLPGRELTRDELVGELVERTSSAHLEQALRSGWGAMLKPAAWAGLLCHGPSSGAAATFTSPTTLPGWETPHVDEAGPALVRAYLGAYGPATRDHFRNWLSRAVRATPVKEWFAAVDDDVVTVDVDGEPMVALAEHADELAAATPARGAVLLGPFDQYVVAVDRSLVPKAHLAKVSRTAGWISAVVLHEGRVAGVWTVGDAKPGAGGAAHKGGAADKGGAAHKGGAAEQGGAVTVDLFEKVPKAALRAAVARHSDVTDTPLRLA